MDEKESIIPEKLIEYIKNEWSIRLDKININTYEEKYEVILGLVNRQVDLLQELAFNPHLWTPKMAPLFLRPMIDLHITLSWILLDLDARIKEYIDYGLGQEKLLLEHHNNIEEERRTPAYNKIIEEERKKLDSEKYRSLIDVDVGNIGNKSLRDKAKECGLDEMYKFGYIRNSWASHNTWNFIRDHYLTVCQEPLHRFHRIPSISENIAYSQFIIFGCKYLDRTFNKIDTEFKITLNTKSVENFYMEF